MNARHALELWHSTFDLYRADDAESAAMRAHQLGQVVRLAPALVAANLVNGAMLMLMFAPRGGWAPLLWSGALLGLLALMLRGWWHWRRRAPQRASARALRRAAWQAMALGALWGLAPLLWFHAADGDARMLLAVVVTGMMGGGAFVLVPLPASALAYIAMLTLAGAAALLRQPGAAMQLTLVLLLSYGFTLALGAMAGARKSNALLRAQMQTARQERILSVLLQDFEAHAAEALWELGPDARLTHVSPRLAEMLAQPAAALQRASLVELLLARSPQAAALLQQALAAGRPFSALQLEMRHDGSGQWWSVSGKPLFGDSGQAQGWRGVIADVSAEVRAQQRLVHLAHHDVLTGLANRARLHERLRQQATAADAGALLLVDLDHFKAVNDTLGHSTGDALLKVVAVRLSACARPGDLVARLGGDEFAMLAHRVDSIDDAMLIAQRLVAVLQQPIATAGRQLRVGASVGVALMPEHGRGVDELFGRADLALYEAKGLGRGRAAVYEPRLGERRQRQGNIEHGLRQALDGGQLLLHWQAQVDIDGGRICGAEGLLRWRHDTLGAVAPAEFVAVAEHCGLIQEIGDRVLDQACRAAAGALQGLQVAINVSPAQLRDTGFAERVLGALARHGVDARRLELEITESLFIGEADGALEQLGRLRGQGVRIALDDFGTGYSSLAYLRRFPFDTLKIDRSFIAELPRRSDADAIVRAMVQLARGLGMRTVAEGVETREQLDLVRQVGCEQAQGFAVARPVSDLRLAELRAGWRGWPRLGLPLH